MQHKRAFRVLIATVTLNVAFGLAYSASEHIAVWKGLYCALGTSTTVGCDVLPDNPAGYWLIAAMMVTVVPLLASVFSFFTTELTAGHVDARHEELKASMVTHVDTRHEELKQHLTEVVHGKPEGSADGAGGADSGQRVPGHPGGG